MTQCAAEKRTVGTSRLVSHMSPESTKAVLHSPSDMQTKFPVVTHRHRQPTNSCPRVISCKPFQITQLFGMTLNSPSRSDMNIPAMLSCPGLALKTTSRNSTDFVTWHVAVHACVAAGLGDPTQCTCLQISTILGLI